MKLEFCKKDNISDVMKFIDTYWSKNHILSKSKELIDYQHYDNVNEQYNYVVAYNDDMQIEGLLGFIPTNKYSLVSNSSLWLSLWKTIPGSSPQLGLRLLGFLEKNVTHNLIGTLGISDEANHIYKILRYKVGIMDHYYIANPNIDNCKVCLNPIISSIDIDENSNITEINENTLKKISFLHEFTPYKNTEYLINKYIKHPIYNYKLLYVDTIKLILVAREININKTCILRIVDVFGELKNIKKSSNFLLNYIIKNNYEYVDLINYGLDSESLVGNGFIKLNSNNNKTIIPMYFEPFIQENDIVRYAYKTKKENVVLFKADADQDRPNRLEEK